MLNTISARIVVHIMVQIEPERTDGVLFVMQSIEGLNLE